MRVLITGAAGWTAAAIVGAVGQAGHDVIAFDLPGAGHDAPRIPGVGRAIAGDVSSSVDVTAAMRSADAVVHLAVAVEDGAYRTPDLPFAVNVRGTYNVFAAARQRAVGKVVLMGEAAVHVPPRDGERLDARTDWRGDAGDDHLYDLTKRLQEEIAKDFCATHGMTAVVLRASHVVDGRAGVDPHGVPLEEVTYARGGWVCRYDLARACVLALTLPTTGYNAFHVIGSREASRRFDIERTERELGLRFDARFERYGRADSRSHEA